MFTGIVEEVGRVASIARSGISAKIEITASTVLIGTKIGDSIAVNGVCLTVCSLGSASFAADVMHETLERSSLGALSTGSKVNLERAMAADGRFGGHIVSGHIDGTGRIAQLKQDGIATRYTIQASSELLHYMVEKGSVAIDGTSLTITAVDASSFEVSLIPHTMENTVLSTKRAGDIVNLECDIIGKYVEKLIGRPHADAEPNNSGLTMEFLAENGF